MNVSMPDNSTSTFPLLKVQEILQCCNEMGVPFAEDELKNPVREGVGIVYETFLLLICGVKNEDLLKKQFSSLNALSYPELHDEAVPEVALYRAMYSATNFNSF